MPNDLTIADVQQLIRQEFTNQVEELKRNQELFSPEENNDDDETEDEK